MTETDTLGTDITVITYTFDSQNRLNGTVTTLAELTVVTGDEGTSTGETGATTGASTITSWYYHEPV